jgi:VCBS repeat protein
VLQAATFYSITASDVPAVITDVSVGDVTGDRIPDIVGIDGARHAIAVFAVTGHGGFAPAEAVPTDIGPRALALADLDGNGALDIVVATQFALAIALARCE